VGVPPIGIEKMTRSSTRAYSAITDSAGAVGKEETQQRPSAAASETRAERHDDAGSDKEGRTKVMLKAR